MQNRQDQDQDQDPYQITEQYAILAATTVLGKIIEAVSAQQPSHELAKRVSPLVEVFQPLANYLISYQQLQKEPQNQNQNQEQQEQHKQMLAEQKQAFEQQLAEARLQMEQEKAQIENQIKQLQAQQQLEQHQQTLSQNDETHLMQLQQAAQPKAEWFYEIYLQIYSYNANCPCGTHLVDLAASFWDIPDTSFFSCQDCNQPLICKGDDGKFYRIGEKV